MASPVLGGEGRVTRERYWQLVEDGVIDPDDRVELLEGVIVTMSPQGPPHAAAIARVSQVLARHVGSRASVRGQSPMNVGEFSVPEPDVALLEPRNDDYVDAHPETAYLVVEVAMTSVLTDRITKASIYAAAGIVEYWIVNVRDDGVEVHRRPNVVAATYEDVTTLRDGDGVELVAFSDVSIAVAELLLPQR